MHRAARATGSLIVSALVLSGPAGAQASPAIPDADRVRLSEALRLAGAVRAGVWPGWERTPMPLLFVGDTSELLIGHPEPGPGFTPLARDSLLGDEPWIRPRQLSPTLLATFPAVRGRSTIVVGSAERTGKSSSRWVLTLLHEHFHQWQTSLPGYYHLATGLGLARGDTTGGWMLDYPFPYDSVPVQRAVDALARSVSRALAAPPADGGDALETVRATRDALRRLLAPADYRYLEFQLWQEGVPRFVELAAADAAGRAGEPPARFRELGDYIPYAELATTMRRELDAELNQLSLERDRRTGFYPLGAGIALLLERTRPDWKDVYRQRPFALAELLSARLEGHWNPR